METQQPTSEVISPIPPLKSQPFYHRWLVYGMLVLVIVTGLLIHQNYRLKQEVSNTSANTSNSYYENLKQQCNQKQSKGCCLSSVVTMESGGYKLAEGGICPVEFKKNVNLCIDSYEWCEPTTSQSIDKTADWDYYEDINRTYRLKYPNGWVVGKNTSNGYIPGDGIQFSARDNANPSFFFVPVPKKDGVDMVDNLRELSCEFTNLCEDNPHYQESPSEPITVNGMSGMRITWILPVAKSDSGYGHTTIQTLLTGEKQNYWFEYSYISDAVEKDEALRQQIEESVRKVTTYEQILSTLEDNPPIECISENILSTTPYPQLPPVSIPSDWKSYVEEDLGISFYHPLTWKPEKTNQYNTALPSDTISLGGPAASISVVKNRCDEMIEEQTRSLLCRFYSSCTKDKETSVQLMQINGKQAVKITTAIPDMFSVGPIMSNVAIGIRDKKSFYFLHTLYFHSDDEAVVRESKQSLQESEENLAIFEKIVSTFTVITH